MDVDDDPSSAKPRPRESEGGGGSAGSGSGSAGSGSKGGAGTGGAGRARVKDEELTEETAVGSVKREVGVGGGAGKDHRSDKRRGKADGGGSPERDARAKGGEMMMGTKVERSVPSPPTGSGKNNVADAATKQEESGRGGEGEPPTDSERIVRVVGFCLVRHAMQDTFGEDAVTSNDAEAEVVISTDGAQAKLRVIVSSPSPLKYLLCIFIAKMIQHFLASSTLVEFRLLTLRRRSQQLDTFCFCK